MSWPIALPDRPQVEADLLPEVPAVDWTYAALSPVSDHDPDEPDQVRSNSSVIPDGGLIDLLAAMAKKPTTMSPETVVLTDGAVGYLVLGVNAPLCASIGVVRSTPLTSRMPPVAEDAEPRAQA